jgi:hypothetical protein
MRPRRKTIIFATLQTRELRFREVRSYWDPNSGSVILKSVFQIAEKDWKSLIAMVWVIAQ